MNACPQKNIWQSSSHFSRRIGLYKHRGGNGHRRFFDGRGSWRRLAVPGPVRMHREKVRLSQVCESQDQKCNRRCCYYRSGIDALFRSQKKTTADSPFSESKRLYRRMCSRAVGWRSDTKSAPAGRVSGQTQNQGRWLPRRRVQRVVKVVPMRGILVPKTVMLVQSQ